MRGCRTARRRTSTFDILPALKDGACRAFWLAKANADSITHANDARMEAAKVGLATGAQRLASAWAMVSADARVSDNTNLNISA